MAIEILSDWQFIRAGVLQGSILVVLLYINDIVADIHSCVRLFADATSLYIIVDNPISAAKMTYTDLETIPRWAEKRLLKFNPSNLNPSWFLEKIIETCTHN